MREAIKAADLVLIPSRPRAFDLHALEGVAELIAFSKKGAFVVLNAVPSGATRQVAEATEIAKGLGLETCPVTFGERADFQSVMLRGRRGGRCASRGRDCWCPRWVHIRKPSLYHPVGEALPRRRGRQGRGGLGASPSPGVYEGRE